jgi:3-oxoacyl-[acyl-carrier protein] reductase
MFTSIAGQTAIVTGASRGIGRGIAMRLGSVGCNVLVISRSSEGAERVVSEIKAAGGSASAAAIDVSDPDQSPRMAEVAIERYGTINILCANAGIFPASKLDKMTAQEFDAVMGTNLRGTFLAVQACLPEMKARGKGRIVLTSSITGPITGYPGWAHYGASKAGQLGFMRTAAIELAPSHITMNAVMPGNIATEGLVDLGPEYITKMEGSIPMGRLGTVGDIANATLFFASDEAAYITGQTLIIDGGQVLPESLMALEEMNAT